MGYREYMVLIICTKNESNLIGTEIWFRTDKKCGRTDGRNGRTDGRTDDAKTISLRLRRGITNTKPVPTRGIDKKTNSRTLVARRSVTSL